MEGQETAPLNEVNLAALLGLPEGARHFVVGKPKRDEKLKEKTFSKRVRRA